MIRRILGREPGNSIRASTLCHPADIAAQPPPVITTRPFIGVVAVLLGSIISTLDSRITTFGLADVRGAVHAGFDEGAWVTTAFTVGQMLIGPVSAWLGMVFGPRRVLMISSAIFTLSIPPAVLGRPPFGPDVSVHQRPCLRHLYPAHHRICGAESSAPARRKWSERLCNEPGIVAQYCGFNRRLVQR